jgi:hypothetical protein
MCKGELLQRDERPTASHELLTALAKKLMPLGGMGIEDRRQPHLKGVLEHGRQFTERVRLEPGAAQECHQNAAKVWAEDPKANLLVTGYALTRLPLVGEDGPRELPFWVVHSWVLRGETLVETTCQHDAYFGVVLSATAAYKSFYADVISRAFPDGEESAEFRARYSHLRPIMADVLREAVEHLPAEQLLDFLVMQLTVFGESAIPVFERLGKLKQSGPLTPEKAAFLRTCMSQLVALLAEPNRQPRKGQNKPRHLTIH